MTTSHFDHEERDLFDFADAVNAGDHLYPRTDLEDTYLRVQRALQGGGLSDDLRHHIWEDTMSALPLTPRKHSSPPSLGGRYARESGWRIRGMAWASIAAVVLTILAVQGTRWLGSDDTPPQRPAPQGVAGLAPNNAQVALVASTPVSPVDAAANAVTVPIFNNVDSQPQEGPVIWLSTSGDVYYDDGVQASLIATNATDVRSFAPNVIMIVSDDPAGAVVAKDGSEQVGYAVTYFNLVSGKTLVDDQSASSYLGSPTTFGTLQLGTFADSPGLWSIANFDTMESRALSDISGGLFRSSDSVSVDVSADYSTIAIGSSQYQSEAAQLLVKQSGLPGEIFVVNSDLELVGWVTIPADMPAVGNMALSPDGSHIALISTDRAEGQSTMTVSVVDIASGQEMIRTSYTSDFLQQFQWVDGGNAYVVTNGNVVTLQTLDGSEQTELLRSEGTVIQMPMMEGSSALYFSVSDVPLGETMPQPSTNHLVILDPTTGDSISVAGLPWFQGIFTPEQNTLPLAPIPVNQTDGDESAVMIHPVTGEVISGLAALSPVATLSATEISTGVMSDAALVQTVVTAQSAPVSLVALTDGTYAVVTITGSTAEVDMITIPTDAAGQQVTISPDGQTIVAGAQWFQQTDEPTWVMNLGTGDSEWTQLPSSETINFATVSGT